MVDIGCFGEDCWFQNNPDRIREFDGLISVIVNDPSAVGRYQLRETVCEEEEIGLCEPCLNHVDGLVGRCEICERWMLGKVIFEFDDICSECLDHVALAELLDQDETVYAIVLDCLREDGFVVGSENKYAPKHFRGKSIADCEFSRPWDFARQLMEYSPGNFITYYEWKCGLEMLLDDELLYEKALLRVGEHLYERIHEQARRQRDANKEAERGKKRRRDEKNHERVTEWIPALDFAAYQRVRKRLKIKTSIPRGATLEDFLEKFALSASVQNQWRPLVEIE